LKKVSPPRVLTVEGSDEDESSQRDRKKIKNQLLREKDAVTIKPQKQQNMEEVWKEAARPPPVKDGQQNKKKEVETKEKGSGSVGGVNGSVIEGRPLASRKR